MKRVIYFTSSHQIGLSSLWVEPSIFLAKNKNHKFLFISGEKEQEGGLFNQLDEKHVNRLIIKGLDDHKRFWYLVNSFCKYAKDFAPDLVHVQTNWQLAIVIAVKYLFRVKYHIFYTIHGYRHNEILKSIIAKWFMIISLATFTDKVFVPSLFLKKKFSILNKKLFTLFLGVERTFFNSYQPLSWDGTKRIIFPGEFRKGKNQEVLIRIIKNYIEITGDKNIELYLPGKGAKLNYCKKMCKKLNLEQKVFFPGPLNRSNILKCYLNSQFVIIPTNVETFGLCIAEAFVLGRVIISRPVGVAEDVIFPEETGYLFKTEKELLKILIEILFNKHQCNLISKNTFNKRDVFRWENIYVRYLELINELSPL